MNEMKVFTGTAHPELARAVTKYLGIPLGQCEVFDFSNENTFVRILENVRQRDVFVIQPFCSPVNHNIMEFLIMLDAFKRSSAGRITAVVPYYAYARTDKKDQPRVPITARLLADVLTVAGANRILTMDLHAAQIQGFFNIPVDELTALNILGDYFKKKNLSNPVVVATDIGITKRARDLAAILDAPLAIMEKRRIGNADRTETLNVIGDVAGKTAVTVDDEIDTGGSLTNTVNTLVARGASAVYSCCTHPVFSGPCRERIAGSPVKEVVVTDTIPLKDNPGGKITVLSIAPLLGEAIHRIHTGKSVGALFEQQF
ncbi:MAG: ribose-phosphate pyrophosphokinase [Dehalococcoidaceae bacterium]|nr:ribose-phosphate pyrophosphokinase [Dehalococcoidaceae bacterium]